jgi:hypothetical protein
MVHTRSIGQISKCTVFVRRFIGAFIENIRTKKGGGVQALVQTCLFRL